MFHKLYFLYFNAYTKYFSNIFLIFYIYIHTFHLFEHTNICLTGIFYWLYVKAWKSQKHSYIMFVCTQQYPAITHVIYTLK